jgi:hypothetical protein
MEISDFDFVTTAHLSFEIERNREETQKQAASPQSTRFWNGIFLALSSQNDQVTIFVLRHPNEGFGHIM